MEGLPRWEFVRPATRDPRPATRDPRPATQTPTPTPTATPKPRPTPTPNMNSDSNSDAYSDTRCAHKHLLATAILSGQIALPGTDNSNNESCFQIHRSSDDVTFSLIATVRDNVITYTDNGRTAVDLLLSSTGYRPLPQLLVKLQHQQHPQLKPDLLRRSAIISQTSRG
jgi:hypothetical protein